jgi:signal transduction histidine kinase
MSVKQRKQNYIDSHVQGALLRRICIHWVLFFFVTALAIISLQALLGDPEKSISDRVQFETGEFMFMGIVMISLFPAFMLDTIRFSNRFVGPIARLRRFMRDLKTGKTEHCSFRDNDFWNEMALEFNQVADLVGRQQAEIADLKNKLNEAGVEA